MQDTLSLFMICDIYGGEPSERHMISVIIQLVSSIHAHRLTAQPLIPRVEPPDLTVLELWQLVFRQIPEFGFFLASEQIVQECALHVGRRKVALHRGASVWAPFK